MNLRIDVPNGDRTTVGDGLAATTSPAPLPFAVARLSPVTARGVADSGSAVRSNIDRARPFPLTLVLDGDHSLSRLAPLTIAATPGFTLLR